MKKEIDPKYSGIPNICFSSKEHFPESMENKFAKQRATRGFDDSEIWSLDHTICKFMIPRLERFIEIDNFINEAHKKKTIDFLSALKLYVKGEYFFTNRKKESLVTLNNFRSVLNDLWY